MKSFPTLQKIAKKNRKTVLTIACFVLATAVELSVSFINKETKIIDNTVMLSDRNRVKIEKLEKDISRHNLQLQTIVTRLSFNAYIKHTDDRFKVENETDSQILQSLGVVSGRVSGLEKIIYALNMYELRSAREYERPCKNTAAKIKE